LSQITTLLSEVEFSRMCFATTDEAMGNILRSASFRWRSDLEVHFQKLPVRQFIDAQTGGNFHFDIL
jgi:hypothetical protein